MKNTFINIRPDSFSGLLFGLEGLLGGKVLLNSPTGCKFYHSAVVDGNTMREVSFDPLKYPENFYFGQGPVPCTYLDQHDYIYGAEEKILALLEDIKTRDLDFIALVNSPGAHLIGDDLIGIVEKSNLEIPYITIDSPGFSKSYGFGLQKGLIELIQALDPPEMDREKRTINLLGFHIYEKHFRGNIHELKRLLKLCGINVNVTFVDQTLDQLRDLRKAELNLVLYPEYGLNLAKFLKREYNMDYYVPKHGLPVGFQHTEFFFKEIVEKVGGDTEALMEEVEKARARAYLFLARYSSLLGIPKGAAYSLYCESSMALGLSQFLTDYLGMIPTGICLLDDSYPDYVSQLKNLETRFGPILVDDLTEAPYEILFADGTNIAASRDKEDYLCGVEILEPSMGYLHPVEKTFFGPKGALYFLELILNGLSFE